MPFIECRDRDLDGAVSADGPRIAIRAIRGQPGGGVAVDGDRLLASGAVLQHRDLRVVVDTFPVVSGVADRLRRGDDQMADAVAAQQLGGLGDVHVLEAVLGKRVRGADRLATESVHRVVPGLHSQPQLGVDHAEFVVEITLMHPHVSTPRRHRRVEHLGHLYEHRRRLPRGGRDHHVVGRNERSGGAHGHGHQRHDGDPHDPGQFRFVRWPRRHLHRPIGDVGDRQHQQ